MTSPIILALDTSELSIAHEWVKATRDYVGAYKLGLEFFLNFGKDGVRSVADLSEKDIFLDLKLHDIPNTVAGAVFAVSDLKPRFLTVHASGGPEMIQAAANAAPDTAITAVTILTSLSEQDAKAVGFTEGITITATKMASLAAASGAGAIVCSPMEISDIRSAVGPSVEIITPGVRVESLGDDQKRTKTPAQAIAEGANFLVIGRPITGAWKDGAKAMTATAAKIAESTRS